MATGRAGTVVTPDDFLGRNDDRAFTFGDHLLGAFGGVFGGALAAATVIVARDAAPGRVPASLDCRFLRALPAGSAHAVAEVLHAGRSMTSVQVDLVDERGRTATHATITLVDVDTLGAFTTDDVPVDWASGDGTPWRNPRGIDAPIIGTLKPRTVAVADDTVATAIDVPWDATGGDATAEAVCLAADLCVGPPVALALRGTTLGHPNPDVSLRLAGATTIPPGTLVGAGRLASLAGGIAVTTIDVAAAGRLVGAGASFSVLLERR